ncbi:glucans biosynthesis glucosyltransferase MdoH [Aquincola sp. J276]|uniref:glucans biosynthesis glucosyltransferase MdoH n=1 Tax=Aquincola sp. J276 TaxID=2898432 RepID=UPI002151A09F|nr:glucans biosynthesis glucosyltransferase MdoH [Aquincola sp. J276]MCR5865089.1 glucans biosynthesis glucosyltransferase MdoH [Aquincola sp. J276]
MADSDTQHRAASAPPLRRGSMPPRPWFGVLRGLALALMPGVPRFPKDRSSPWRAAADRRRTIFLWTVLLVSGVATWLLPATDGDMTAVEIVQTGLFALLFGWLSAGFITAMMGFKVALFGDKHALTLPDERMPLDPTARTALIMPICNEDIDTVFTGLRKTCESLAATGALKLFDVYVLSDSSDPAIQAAEVEAWKQLRRTLGDDGEPLAGEGRIFYRWRKRRTKRKAGNVADFCRRWGNNYRYMVVLDADSTMTGETLVQMVRMMEAHPKTGILQTLPRTQGHSTLHARTQQFASAVTGRLFALGLAYWQLGESHYWGHNAILRIEPFMKHCALAPLEGRGGLSGEILSHDFVEAALMRRAGYEVWLAPNLEGSFEQQPTNLLDELGRDRRWCQGNLQNFRLIAEPGWQPVHRAMFFTGALSYITAPVWLAFVAAGVWRAATQPEVDASMPGLLAAAGGEAAALWALTLTLLLLPRLLGVVGVLLRKEQALFGGTAQLLRSSVVELFLSALQAPVRMLAHTMFVIGGLTGLKLQWKSPPRDAESLGWKDAFTRLAPMLLPALALFGAAMLVDANVSWMLVPLLLATPLVVYGSREQEAADGRLPRTLLTPVEHAVQVRLGLMAPASAGRASRRPALPSPAATAGVALAPARAIGRWPTKVALAFVPAVMATAVLAPQPLATSPEPPRVVAEMDTRYAERVPAKRPVRTAAVRVDVRSKMTSPAAVLPPAVVTDESVADS